MKGFYGPRASGGPHTQARDWPLAQCLELSATCVAIYPGHVEAYEHPFPNGL
jgi:hypothetical protein